MVMCSRCHKNVAVVFITKMENGKTINEGLCLNCAKELGLPSMDKIIPNMGDIENLSDEDIKNVSGQLAGLFGGELPGNLADMMGGEEFDGEEPPVEEKVTEPASGKKKNKKKMLETFGTNLNEKAKEGKVDPVIGREKEIERMIEILNRRQKNNPCLLGEPGVGKTAIAEGLAVRIVEKKVPEKLLDKEDRKSVV